MSIDQATIVFFDASCLIAAARSPSGGSGFLLSLCERRLLTGAVSQPVLLEAESNVRDNFGESELAAYYRLLARTPLLVAPLPPARKLKSLAMSVNQKDTHVVGAALAVKAPYLVSLDRNLVREVNQASLTLEAFVPGDFIKTILPHHVVFPSLRD